MIVIDDIAQLSPEWFKLHAGILGASSFNKIVTTKGEPSKQRQDYIYELAGQRITGVCENGYQSYAMQIGAEREAEARSYYEFLTGETVRQVGFVFKDENRKIGCSPDGLLGMENPITKQPAGLEIKCPLMKTHVKYLLNGKLPTEYFIQVQGSMWVCGLHSWIFMSYYPGMEAFIVEVQRDYEFCGALEYELERFIEELDAVEKELRG